MQGQSTEALSIENLEVRFLIFEIVPLERIGFNEPTKEVQSIASSLQQVGLESLNTLKKEGVLWFKIKDKQKFEQTARTITPPQHEDELPWLLTEFFEYLILLPTS